MNVKTEVTENIVTPQICTNEDEFVKMMLMEVLFQTDNVDPDPEQLVGRLKVFIHDYLALVLSGKLKPYEVYENGLSKKHANDVIRKMGVLAGKVGVPIKETNEGKLELDFETIKKHANDDIIE